MVVKYGAIIVSKKISGCMIGFVTKAKNIWPYVSDYYACKENMVDSFLAQIL